MQFTLKFVEFFFTGLCLAAPMLGLFVVVIISLGQIVGKLERWDVFTAFYWSFITATTVGYGDLRPAGKVSRSLAIVIAFTGLIFTGIVIAIALESATLSFRLTGEFDDIIQKIEQLR